MVASIETVVGSHIPSAAREDLLDGSALEQARAIRERRVSSEELVRAYLARIEHANPQLNAFVDVAYTRAPRWARRKDAQRAAYGSAPPPFHGVPIGIKDLNFVRGFRTHFGSRSMRYMWSIFDDFTVRALRRAGFVILGKLATSEAGAMPIVEPDIHPPTRNPWNLEHSAGGSSGGSAAAVAAGLLPLAQGSDGGGSIRIPAALCNLFGFKPSRGRVRNAFGLDTPRLLYTCGPITRSVDDAAALLDVMNNGQRPAQRFVEAIRQPVSGLRIRFTHVSPFGAADPEQVEAMFRVVRQLDELGHHVEPADELSRIGAIEEFLPLWESLIASAPLLRFRIQPITRWLVDEARSYTQAQIANLHDRSAAAVDEVFGDADILVTPTTPIAAPRVGLWRNLPPSAAFRAAGVLGGFTAPFNITGQPACSLPVAFNSTGLPVGVQLVGRRGQDGLVFAVARQLEQALPAATVLPQRPAPPSRNAPAQTR